VKAFKQDVTVRFRHTFKECITSYVICMLNIPSLIPLPSFLTPLYTFSNWDAYTLIQIHVIIMIRIQIYFAKAMVCSRVCTNYIGIVGLMVLSSVKRIT
jgi:hypothetical protein